MFTLNEDLSIYATRGDAVFFSVQAEYNGETFQFQPGDVVRLKIYGKKNAENVLLQKDFPVTVAADSVAIYLTEADTKLGEVISKPTDYWYEVELNPFTEPQTIIGYDEDGAKIFRLFPEGNDVPEFVVTPEDIPVVDKDLDLVSTRPVQNQAIARAVVQLRAAVEDTKKTVMQSARDLAVEKARIDNLVAGGTAGDAEVVDMRVDGDGVVHASAGDAVRHNERKLDTLKRLLGMESVLAVNSYDKRNTSVSVTEQTPFLFPAENYNYHNCLIESVKFYIEIPGTISIGYTSGTIRHGDVYDASQFVFVEELIAEKTGETTVALSNPFVVPDGCLLAIGNRTDTGKFKFGSNANDKKFMYVLDGAFGTSPNGLGVDIRGTKTIGTSAYSGKTLSILGDSISTYDGYIPAGNATYYPSETVDAVEKTWWHKLIAALGMRIEVNNSWSGSRVTTTNGEEAAGCMSRCENLGSNPDVIIVWMGINDFNNEVALGEYDGSRAVPASTTTFREAYAIMLNKILEKYKTSEIWVCTLAPCERNSGSGFPEVNEAGVPLMAFNKAIRELAEAFGVRVLEHSSCGMTYQNMSVYDPNKLHPNANGHSLIANNDIFQIAPGVHKRYGKE